MRKPFLGGPYEAISVKTVHSQASFYLWQTTLLNTNGRCFGDTYYMLGPPLLYMNDIVKDHHRWGHLGTVQWWPSWVRTKKKDHLTSQPMLFLFRESRFSFFFQFINWLLYVEMTCFTNISWENFQGWFLPPLGLVISQQLNADLS